MAEMIELVRNKDFCGYHYIPDKDEASQKYSDLVVVCFDTISGGLKKKGFGVDFLIKNGVECVFFSHAKKSYFQRLSIDLFKKYVAPVVLKKKYSHMVLVLADTRLYIMRAQLVQGQ